ncbi:hypothetical protein BY458DRAFT_517762 [Sporodiniella umbellata]|nr:hypothetical protein BY458DRAFT_517762 [Sporodiniella umbellata]
MLYSLKSVEKKWISLCILFFFLKKKRFYILKASPIKTIALVLKLPLKQLYTLQKT